MTDNRWWTYVQFVTRGAPANEVAAKSGFDKSNMTRWKKGEGVQPSFVVKFARAYGRPVVEALAEYGLITDEEAEIREVRVVDIADLTDAEFIAETHRRLDAWSPVLTSSVAG